MEIIFAIIFGVATCYYILKEVNKKSKEKANKRVDAIAQDNQNIFWENCATVPTNIFSWYIRGYATRVSNISLSNSQILVTQIKLLNQLIGVDRLFEKGLVEQSDKTRNDFAYHGPEVKTDAEGFYILTVTKSAIGFENTKTRITTDEAHQIESIVGLVKNINIMVNNGISNINLIDDEGIKIVNEYIANII